MAYPSSEPSQSDQPNIKLMSIFENLPVDKSVHGYIFYLNKGRLFTGHLQKDRNFKMVHGNSGGAE